MGSSAPCWSQRRVEESFRHGERGIAHRKDTLVSLRCSKSFCARLLPSCRTSLSGRTLLRGQKTLWVQGLTQLPDVRPAPRRVPDDPYAPCLSPHVPC